MPISWNEIRHNAIKFSREWAGVKSESAEKQTFWNEFFQVFGIKRRVVASFEEAVKKISGDYGRIDLFWPGVLLVEHKSFGEDLRKAETQAFDYIRDLANDPKRRDEIPRYIIVSDFARIALHDLEPEEQRDLPLFDARRGITHEFPLADFHRHIHEFAFIPGYKQHTFQEEDPVNIEAVEIMGALHDALEFGGYKGHDLERFLVRVLFCLFAERAGIFETSSFRLFIENRTASDGSDLGEKLARLFEVLNTAPEDRQTNLDETLAAFPYVNGDLFNEHLGFADFNRDMRNALLACTRKDWSRISPAIFGSLFQSIMDDRKRRQIGAHYTSERDILKVIRSLFLDELRAEFQNRKADRSTGRHARLEEFHKSLCSLRFFDPACGCGNFLVIGYRELRQLELELLQELLPATHGEQKGFQQVFSAEEVAQVTQVDVDQFYGIEIGEWPARIAEVALWLMDHQMNLKVSEAFGQLYQRLPLKKSPAIVCGNALRLDWKSILPPEKCSFVLGNPPFVGKKARNAEQQADMGIVFGDVKGTGVLDYVCCWYLRAAQYIRNTQIKVAFVSTNSITQGEQPGVIWSMLFRNLNLKIHFAHRTFAWESEARGKAHVHVVIIGFGAFDTTGKRIYDYESEKGTVVPASNISPYLVEGRDAALDNREKPICNVPEIQFGNMPNDDGYFLLTDQEKRAWVIEEPSVEKYLSPLLSAKEYLHGENRWCLWLKNVAVQDIRGSKEILRRVEAVREYRTASKREATRKLADSPSLFGEIRQPDTKFVLVPRHSSETRRYIPLSYFSPDYIVSDSCLFISDATLFHFGVLMSGMHMAWVRQVCGRIKSDYRYSNKLVYNNFPWPNATAQQRERAAEKARAVLAARKPHLPPRGLGTLADLYDPLTMPSELLKAHAGLDRAVEKCYRTDQFHSDRERVEFLFSLYEKLSAPLLPVTARARSRGSQSASSPRGPKPQRTPALPGQNQPTKA